MSTSKHRTSFALDQETIDRLRHLSRIWQVSQAEVVRRAVRRAEEETSAAGSMVRERLSDYRAEGRIGPSEADSYLSEVSADREEWRAASSRAAEGRSDG